MDTAKKILILVLVIGVALFVTSCAIIEVPTANVYSEVDTDSSDDSFSYEEVTGQTIDGTQWFEISGSFDGEDDSDTYVVNVASGVTSLDIHVFHNGTEVNSSLLLGINTFPLTVYDGSTSHINAASGGGTDISASAGTLDFTIYAVSQTLLGGALPYTSGTYKVQFR